MSRRDGLASGLANRPPSPRRKRRTISPSPAAPGAAPMNPLPALLDAYLAGPRLLRQAVAGMTREQLTARPVASKMSTLEVVCHLVDFDPVYADRMKRAIALDRPTLLGADESLFLKALAY